MRYLKIMGFLIIPFLFCLCSKDKFSNEEKLVGLWECDSTICGSIHSYLYKIKKYDFKKSGDFRRDFGIMGFWDYGTWYYENSSSYLVLQLDSVWEEVRDTLIERIEVENIGDENLILIEDYDSAYLYNGEVKYIREFYTKKK